MKVQLIRNATMKIEYGNHSFLTDPLLGQKASYLGFLDRDNLVNPMTELPLPITEIIQNIDFVLASHTHIPAEDEGGPSDHFDKAAIESLDKKLPIYTQPYDIKGLQRVGFDNVHGIENTLSIDGIKITRILGRHSDMDALLPLVGDSSAYILEADNEPTIFWTGDTLLTDEMKKIVLGHQPDICIVHAGGANLSIDDKGTMSKLVMNDDDTIELAKLLPHSKIIPIHLESLDHCPVTRETLKAKAAAFNLSHIKVLEDGETIEF